MPSRRRAFTLVELLVIVAILTVLIALLLPVLGKAREHANRVKCSANLRSVGQALTMYVQQYRYYPGAYASGGKDVFAVWPVRLRAMAGGEQDIFYCPSQDPRCRWVKGDPPPTASDAATVQQARFGYDLGEPVLWRERVWFSYGYNAYGYGALNARALGYIIDSGNDRELPASRVRVASEMVAITDSTADGYGDTWVGPLMEPLFPGRVHPGRAHFGGANVLFCDGHVQWHAVEDLAMVKYPTTTEEWWRWGSIVRMWNCDHIWATGL